ncbi:MAG: hypothetical protein II574_04610 [Ruminococcus sp.]|nr:hypothetical protein [Ruminococcus sp.]
MYKKSMTHSVLCGNAGLVFDSLKVKDEYSVVQLPLISGGFYTKIAGKKWTEIVMEGCISDSDRQRHYDSFIAAASSGEVSLIVDITSYSRCILIDQQLTALPDSRLERFIIRFRSVGNAS